MVYTTDLVLLHVQKVTLPTMESVKNVATNVVLVVVLLMINVSPVVITYSGGTTNVPKNVQKDGIKTY
jgi:uncharacterized integral membrane protein